MFFPIVAIDLEEVPPIEALPDFENLFCEWDVAAVAVGGGAGQLPVGPVEFDEQPPLEVAQPA